MRVIQTGVPGLLVVEPVVHGDDRGYFMETWHASRYKAHGLSGRFVQSNVSRSGAGVLRGLHYQHPKPQGKLISVLEGRIFDVGVDIRPDSPTFMQWAGAELSAKNHDLAQLAATHLSRMKTCFADLFRQAQTQGQIGADHDPERLAARYQSDLLGLRLSAERGDVDARQIAADIAADLERL